MFAVISRLKIKPGAVDEVGQIVQSKVIPEASQLPSFHHYYAIRTGDDSATAITLWDTQAGVEAHMQQVAKLVQQHAGSLIISVERESGEVTLEAGK